MNGTFVLATGSVNPNLFSNLLRIYRYEPETEEWTQLPGRITIERRAAAVILIRKNWFPSCNRN